MQSSSETAVACGSDSRVTHKRAVSASTPALVRKEWPRGLIEHGRPGGCERPGNEAAERVTGGNASDPTARFLKGRHAGHCKAFGNHVRHVSSGPTCGRFEEREGIRMSQEQLVMFWPCA